MLPFLRKGQPLFFQGIVILGGLAPFLAVAKLPYNWLLIFLLLMGWNGISALLILATYPFEKPLRASHTASARIGTSFAVSMAGFPLAAFFASMEQWMADVLWSSYFPINASIDSLSQDLTGLWLSLALLLFFTALHVTAQDRAFTLGRLSRLFLLVFFIHLTAFHLYLLLILIPLWQLDQLIIFPAWVNTLRKIGFQLLVFVSTYSLAGKCYLLWTNGKKVSGAFFGGLGSTALAFIGFAIVTGLPIPYAMLVGQHFETYGTTRAAIPWYSKALGWCQSDNLKSYLQFRMGLLHRKNGNLEESKEAFTRVLVKYHHDARLLLEANEFKDKLEKNIDSNLRRVVIPGIEARTEYKSAYCVPNSMGLILNYWGDRVGAKGIGAEITQLEKGSLITDEIFYAESRGFSNFVLPLRSLEDIFKLIDHGIPVLAFIPGHVLAVFGYDQVLQTLVTYDVNTFDIWDDQQWSHFSQDWSRLYNTLGVIVPAEKVESLKELLGQDLELSNEAYLQFLVSQMKEERKDLMMNHLTRAVGKGFFFADWKYLFHSGRAPEKAVSDSVISLFLLRHDVYETQILEYLRSLYQRKLYSQAVQFIEGYRKENRVSTGIAAILGGCLHKLGESESAVEVLLGSIGLAEQNPITLEFLLKQEVVRSNPELAKQLSLRILNMEEGVTGPAAGLAFWTWRNSTLVDFRNIDESLSIMESYLNNWNPYDAYAIRDLLACYPMKKFRKDDRMMKQTWEKKIRILKMRLPVGI